MQRVQAIASQIDGSAPGKRKAAAAPSAKKYQYTLDGCILNDEQRAFYEENGYLVIPGLFSQQKLDAWANRFRVLCEQPKERPTSMTVMRDVALAKAGVNNNSEMFITKVQDFQDDPALFNYCEDAALLKYVEAFTGPRIVASHTMLINKPTDPGKGSSRHPLHQDQLYFPWQPVDRTVAAWTAMERVTRENGCLIAVPGSHKTDLMDHGYPDWEGGANKAYVGILGVTPDVKYVHVSMNAGDTIFFHPHLWHGSGRNQTPRFRKAICCHFASGDCRFIDVKGTIQEDLESEIKVMAQIKFRNRGIELKEEDLATLKFSDVWSAKSRVVQGDQMILPTL